MSRFFFLLTEKFISDIILMVQGHCQGQKVNFKVHFWKYDFNKYNYKQA